jgi:chromosome segregation ATPase
MLASNMKNRIGVIVAVLICLGLGITLIAIKKQSSEQHRQEIEKNVVLSNNLVETGDKLEKQRQVNVELETDRAKQKKAFEELTNSYSQVSANLTQVSNDLARSEVALKASQEETAKRDAKIAELEAQNQALDKRALELSTAITNLTTQIAETKRKLAASEGEKGFLEGELKRLMAEKGELERQFNDLTILRAQVAKLKEELSIARRLDWIRRGLFASPDEKGAQRLMQRPAASQPKAAKPGYDLDVEVTSDGSVKVVAPLTNRPAGTNPPAK